MQITTAETELPPSLTWDEVKERLRAVDRFRIAVLAVAVTQSLWLGGQALRGWYYQDDFTFMAQASGRRFGWGYLTDPVNEHLTPGLRLQFWIFRHFLPLNYQLTICYRMALQIACTLLLGALLLRLFGRRPAVLLLLAGFAFNPLLVPGFMWLASSANLLPGELFVVLALHAHLSFLERGHLVSAVRCGLLLACSALFWEKMATIALALPVITVCTLRPSWRTIWPHFRARGLGYLIEYLPLLGFSAAFVLGGYGRTSRARPAAGDLAHLVWDALTHTYAPALVGGPFNWFYVSGVYVGAGDAPQSVVWLSAAVFASLLCLGLFQRGLASCLAWLIPVITVSTGTVLVAVGRYTELGGLLTRVYAYSYDSALPLLLAVCFAFLPVRLGVGTDSKVRTQIASTRVGTAVGATLVMVLIGASLVSAHRFVNRWAENPANAYFTKLERNIKSLAPESSIYDTSASLRVFPYTNPVRNLSDVLPLADLHPRFDADNQQPLLVTDSGEVVSATFVPAATASTTSPSSFCEHLLRGTTAITMPLTRAPGINAWFLRMAYFQQGTTELNVTVVDTTGATHHAVGRPQVFAGVPLGTFTLRLPTMNPTTVIVRAQSSSANLCLSSVIVGYPFPAK